MFRYRSDTDAYYAAGDVLSTNYWKMAQVYGGYFWMAALSVASITQLLAIFGIANEYNLYVWIYGLEGIGGLVGIIGMFVSWYAYDSAYAITADSSKTSDEQADAAAVMTGVWSDFVKSSVNDIITDINIVSVSEPWYRYNAEKAGIELGENELLHLDGEGEGEEEMMAKMIKFISI